MKFGKYLTIAAVLSFFIHAIVGFAVLFLSSLGVGEATSTTMPWWIWAWCYGSIVAAMTGMLVWGTAAFLSGDLS